MTETLKPCPFCGSDLKASLNSVHAGWEVVCTNNDCPVDFWAWGFLNEELAIRACNARAPIPGVRP